ncbi:hypothetical protein RVBP17_1090 [Pseudomonas phage sp. 30-3]|uniref:Structural protein n=1 Tax=Pseudomonas phage vB_PaeM_PA5oct TaxID=2163605 RepID=A0A4Y5JUF7_9CAUD|nr:structural protein [Pseudomonas phage vB_PaeM_PA5oct]WMI31743.1 hypothetical protein GBBBJNDB_00040 [Pseudomonas phage Callisto]WPK39193.1 hypothetical protein Cassandra_0517 [Pseudomonas phage Cassandra]WPK39705.1 hypothetical protein Deiofobo_0508 [Pseudomonas phage Deifobo]WPK40226.1 hypothetical protein ETTORE_0517 [Pseudomonas phage Ettore]WPK40741.1 hypothetical protein Paride_0511 [Pseudomonas phage Paride]VOH53679.1 hypothetical protein MIJ3_00040 [Pseudomonas phage vB_PaeM_MIJ3]B
MALDRFSIDMLKRRGASKKVIQTGSSLVNTFENGSGFDNALDATSLILDNYGNSSVGAVNSNMFFALRSFFVSKHTSLPNAETLALMMLDAAKLLNKPPMTLAEEVASTGQLMLGNDTYTVLNFLRPAGEKQNLLIINDNSGKFRGRNVKL